MTNPILLIIKLYQKTLSPDHGWFRHLHPYGYCRFHPSCSDYAIKAISQRGTIIGLLLIIWRIVRCNPWNSGGFDPVK